MTAIPAATEEDFKHLGELTDWKTALATTIFGPTAIRLIAHYQRENEKLGETVKKAREEMQRIENIARSRKMTDLEKILPLVHGVMNLKDILGVEVTDAAIPLTKEFLKAANIEAATPITINNFNCPQCEEGRSDVRKVQKEGSGTTEVS